MEITELKTVFFFLYSNKIAFKERMAIIRKFIRENNLRKYRIICESISLSKDDEQLLGLTYDLIVNNEIDILITIKSDHQCNSIVQNLKHYEKIKHFYIEEGVKNGK